MLPLAFCDRDCVHHPRRRAPAICKVGRLPRTGQQVSHPRPANRRGRSVPVGRPRGRRALSAAAAAGPASKPSKREKKRKKRERETGTAVKSPPRPRVKEGQFLPVSTPAHPPIVKSSGWVPSFWSVCDDCVALAARRASSSPVISVNVIAGRTEQAPPQTTDGGYHYYYYHHLARLPTGGYCWRVRTQVQQRTGLHRAPAFTLHAA